MQRMLLLRRLLYVRLIERSHAQRLLVAFCVHRQRHLPSREVVLMVGATVELLLDHAAFESLAAAELCLLVR